MRTLGSLDHYKPKLVWEGRKTTDLSANLVEDKLTIDDNDVALALFGCRDENLKALGEELGVKIFSRGNSIGITGSKRQVALAQRILADLVKMAGDRLVTDQDVRYAARLGMKGENSQLIHLKGDVVTITARGEKIRPKTLGQKHYLDAMRKDLVVFGIGPAGTGKTYLAMAMAIEALKRRQVDRIILTRPAVEAGERLGFLPGDLQEKVDPYLRPLYDALYDILGMDVFRRFSERGAIEVAPLAYMRGRTLDDSFVILDEAQNTTSEQMKMFLTRLGFGSRMVITGDITQVDLPKGINSGLWEVRKVLKNTAGISVVNLGETDVVRHHLVQRIIRAYEVYEQGQGLNDNVSEA
ncbi:MAG: PhoH family protein [Firmicutes bacterium]|nr:PhoH family protein [Bacillota bacterium]